MLQCRQQPPVLLLDCSKLQLGRGRPDDTVAAFRRRLELFRELTLPMLRTMDQENRLTIVSRAFTLSQHSNQYLLIVHPSATGLPSPFFRNTPEQSGSCQFPDNF